ncbi:ATP-binding protein [Novosphingobium sp. BL-8H]|uniref:ATP-binding response regulator n=1 Tax=Novosphingobium sp. BL-8H TaxID=3127640 RepID=UPI0037575BF0
MRAVSSVLMVKRGDQNRRPGSRPIRDDRRSVSQRQNAETTNPKSATIASDPAIAELQRAKSAAEAANEAKSRYLVAVSHEIRSPLNAIYGYAQLLERGEAVTGAEAGAAIRRSVDHLTNLAESLLEISRIESGVLKIRSGVVDIRALLDQIVSMFRAQAIGKGLTLTLRISDNLPRLVKTDQSRLRQVLINLVSNAIKYTEAGSIEVAVSYRSEVATIDVVDTGIGIGTDEMERVFEPFERGSSTGVQSQPGIGLGLTITRVLAHVLGGDITVTSAVGEGSCFRLKLMLSPAAQASGKETSFRIEGYRGSCRTVLIIEDDPEQRAAMQSLLQSLDFIVHAARNGMEGIELAARHAPDLVLLDVEMPGISGWETALRLRRAHGAPLKIVMASANTTAADTRYLDDGICDAFVAKPVAFDALLATIQQELGLEWRHLEQHAAHAHDEPVSALPLEAAPYLERLRRLAQIGHVLEFETQLGNFEASVPAIGSFAATLREDLGNFDFGAIIEKIENVRSQ